MSPPVTVTLGAHTYKVVAQPIAYLEMALGDVFGQLAGVKDADGLADLAADDSKRGGYDEIAGPGYRVLRVFIPDLMDEHEFRGFASPEAFAAGVRDIESARLSATLPQVVDAFTVIFRVNRLDVIRHLGKVLDPELIQLAIREAIGDSLSTLFSSALSASGAST